MFHDVSIFRDTTICVHVSCCFNTQLDDPFASDFITTSRRSLEMVARIAASFKYLLLC
jgi:hypothetical protein